MHGEGVVDVDVDGCVRPLFRRRARLHAEDAHAERLPGGRTRKT
jgi:hypothetical protein